MADSRLSSVAFRCASCDLQFERAPDRIADNPDASWHPWEYFADCPACGEEAPQIYWQRSLLKAWSAATGPRTPEGKARVTANLEGHPTPEEVRRTRFNAMKHGLFARTATYFPARPGQYPQCEGCEYREYVCPGQVACLKRAELWLQVHVAFDQQDPRLLQTLQSELQAGAIAIMQDMVRSIAIQGVQLKAPVWHGDKEGGIHFVRYADDKGEQRQIYEYQANPLLKHLMDYLAKNSMSLEDLMMTPRVQENQMLEMGRIAAEADGKEHIAEFQRRQTEALEGLRVMIDRGRKRLAGDPALLEHKS